MSDIETFENIESSGDKVYPIKAGNIKIGHYVVISNRPCKITETSVSKTGKEYTSVLKTWTC